MIKQLEKHFTFSENVLDPLILTYNNLACVHQEWSGKELRPEYHFQSPSSAIYERTFSASNQLTGFFKVSTLGDRNVRRIPKAVKRRDCISYDLKRIYFCHGRNCKALI